jgi:hypothetical protein
MVQNPPKKHHYIPQFYLKRWALTDNKLAVYNRPNPRTRAAQAKMKYPAETGWKEGAYQFEGLPEDKRNRLETAFFSMLDGKAADARALMETPGSAWTVELRYAWVMFLMSLISRHPDDIEAFKSVYIRDFNKVSQAEQDAYEKAREIGDPATAEEFFANVGREFLRNMAINNIPKLIMHENAVKSLMNMHWSVARPPPDGYFFTSDRPTIRTFLGRENSHWLVPIGPRKLFVAVERKEYGDRIHKAIWKHGWKEVNRQVVRQAVEFGYAVTEEHLLFFDKHLAKATRPSMYLSFVPDPKTAPPLIKVP